jgi:hypothetical protein
MGERRRGRERERERKEKEPQTMAGRVGSCL